MLPSSPLIEKTPTMTHGANGSYETVEDILQDEALELPSGINKIEDLRRAIDEQLVSLQRAEGPTPERHYKLVRAREALARLAPASPGSGLVSIREQALTDLMVQNAKLVERVTKSTTEDRRERIAAERIDRARDEVRNRRTIPAAAIAGVLTFLWTQRTSFGISTTAAGSFDMFTIIYIYVMVLIAALWLMSIRIGRRDKRVIRDLHDPDFQARALTAMGRSRNSFARIAYARELLGTARHVERPTIFARFQTVDLLDEAMTATDVALTRFVADGWLETERTIDNEVHYRLVPPT